ncbi:MAG: hypothetical protein WCK10_01665 [Candidatus Staskawiczbacteria bacterium]
MSLDFSLLQNIDFINKDNIIFLSILLIIAIIFIIIFWWTVLELIKIIKRTIIRILNIDLKPKFDKKNSTDWLHRNKENRLLNIGSNGKILGDNSMSSRPIATTKEGEKSESASNYYNTKEKEDIAEGLSKLKSVNEVGLKENNSEKKFGNGPIINFFSGTEKTKDKNVVASKSFEEKEKIDIAEGLSKLKSKSILGGGIESKMPSRIDDIGGNQNGEIKIPTPIRHSSQPGFVIEQNNSSIGSNNVALPHRSGKDGSTGSSIFDDKAEISRIKLRHALRYDPKAYKAQKEAGLYNMNREEREGLEKEVFSPIYGRNISKSDLKRGIKKLGTKMRSENNPEAHAKLRKEIKFFKKIGGIK